MTCLHRPVPKIRMLSKKDVRENLKHLTINADNKPISEEIELQSLPWHIGKRYPSLSEESLGERSLELCGIVLSLGQIGENVELENLGAG